LGDVAGIDPYPVDLGVAGGVTGAGMYTGVVGAEIGADTGAVVDVGCVGGLYPPLELGLL
jgi:hypothetical protein